MKKILAVVLMLLTVAFASMTVLTASAEEPTYILNQNFDTLESKDVFAMFAPTYTSDPVQSLCLDANNYGGVYAVIPYNKASQVGTAVTDKTKHSYAELVANGSGKALHLHAACYSADSMNDIPSLVIPLPQDKTGTVVVSFDYLGNVANNHRFLNLIRSTDTVIKEGHEQLLTSVYDATTSTYSVTNADKTVTYRSGIALGGTTYLNVRCEFNFTNKTYSLYFDGVLAPGGENIPFAADNAVALQVGYIARHKSDYPGGAQDVYLDNLKVYKSVGQETTAPAGEESTSASEEDTSAAEEVTSATEEVTSAAEEVTSAAEEVTSAVPEETTEGTFETPATSDNGCASAFGWSGLFVGAALLPTWVLLRKKKEENN